MEMGVLTGLRIVQCLMCLLPVGEGDVVAPGKGLLLAGLNDDVRKDEEKYGATRGLL